MRASRGSRAVLPGEVAMYAWIPANRGANGVPARVYTSVYDAATQTRTEGASAGVNLKRQNLEEEAGVENDQGPDALTIMKFMASLTSADLDAKDSRWKRRDLHVNGTSIQYDEDGVKMDSKTHAVDDDEDEKLTKRTTGQPDLTPFTNETLEFLAAEPPSTSYRQGSHQGRPSPRKLNILDIGAEFIRGQINQLSTPTSDDGSDISTIARKSTVNPPGRKLGSSTHFRRHQHGQHHHHTHSKKNGESSPGFSKFTPLNKRDGPVQCDGTRGITCVDDSCCNTEGKCGFKDGHCGATCVSNCQAKAMCGIDSADGQTPCGLKLCCSFYGWCGTEDVHCHDPEPQYGVVSYLIPLYFDDCY